MPVRVNQKLWTYANEEDFCLSAKEQLNYNDGGCQENQYIYLISTYKSIYDVQLMSYLTVEGQVTLEIKVNKPKL